MKHCKFILLSLFVLSLCKNGQAQNVLDGVLATPMPSDAVTLFITVYDNATKLPIENVNTEISGSDGTSLTLMTNSEGKVNCLLYPFSFKLTYNHDKYKELVESIKFTHAPDTIYLEKYIERR